MILNIRSDLYSILWYLKTSCALLWPRDMSSPTTLTRSRSRKASSRSPPTKSMMESDTISSDRIYSFLLKFAFQLYVLLSCYIVSILPAGLHELSDSAIYLSWHWLAGLDLWLNLLWHLYGVIMLTFALFAIYPTAICLLVCRFYRLYETGKWPHSNCCVDVYQILSQLWIIYFISRLNLTSILGLPNWNHV